jgi:hypothetical protein
VHVDANRPLEVVAAEILAQVDDTLSR